MSTTTEQHLNDHHLTPRRKTGSSNNNNAVPPSFYSTAAKTRLPEPGVQINAGGGAITQSPLSAASAAVKHSQLDDRSISSDSGSDCDSSAASLASSPRANKIDRFALISELATSNLNTTGLSDYELLRLRNIKRNQAKLESLGLFEGITSKPKGGADDGKSERVKKAAETRRRNKMLARERVERHDKEMEELSRKKYGDSDNTQSGRVLPQRAAKAIAINYSSKAIVPSKRRMQWETNLSSLRSFHKQFGTFQISATQHGSEYKSLQQWKCRQRKEYLLFKEGRKSVLDEEQVTLLEQLGGDWLVWSKRGRGGSVSMTRSRKTTRQWSNLWADYSDDDDYEEEEQILAEWEGEETEDDEDDGGEVAIGSSDSFSIVSEESEEEVKHQQDGEKKKYDGKKKSFSREYDSHDSDRSKAYSSEGVSLQHLHRQQQKQRRSISTSRRRRSRRRERSVTKRRRMRDDSPPVKRSKRRVVSSLEFVSPSEMESNWSSPPLKRSQSYGDDYMTPHRSKGRRMPAYSLREEDSVASAEETSFQAGSSRRRRKRYVHQRSSRRDESYEEVIEKPMDEIIVRGDIDSMQAERDKLMAEYGALYGRKCVILEKRDQVEKELRGMEFARKLLADASDS
ncbi:hypothetical protein QTG54_015801 [Skeletonema marinoi]|uniref:Helicase-associated domain-containing protein n=1 Tax=Skeletonema marinoi TaxID=267567 RepID=A0AAD9D5C3_9STRA|nr:hypothetical protein QTG54_015801 [Skeletonema marinoi]